MLPKLEGVEEDLQIIKNILRTTEGHSEKWANIVIDHIRKRFYASDITQITPHFINQALKGEETQFHRERIANEFLKKKSEQDIKNIQTKLF